MKVAPYEAWLVQYVGLRRKAYRKGCEPTELAHTQLAKDSNRSICKQLLLEFKNVVADAKEKHEKRYQNPFPHVLALTFNGCDIFASTGTRQLMIRADDALLKWIRKGFQQALDDHFKAELSAGKAMSQPLIACSEEKVFHYSGNALGVRDKICWVPETHGWGLNLKKETETSRRKSLCLSVNPTVTGADFTTARDKALLNACDVWNALDKSGRFRIKLPAVTDSCCDIKLPKEQNGNDGAGSDSESDSDGGSDD